jgi:hypothetical protein
VREYERHCECPRASQAVLVFPRDLLGSEQNRKSRGNSGLRLLSTLMTTERRMDGSFQAGCDTGEESMVQRTIVEFWHAA